VVAATLDVGWMIMAAAGLSFLGLGAQPPTAEWGVMLSAGRQKIRNSPHQSNVPGAQKNSRRRLAHNGSFNEVIVCVPISGAAAQVFRQCVLGSFVFLNRPPRVRQLCFRTGREELHIVPKVVGRRQRLASHVGLTPAHPSQRDKSRENQGHL
jgi:hypothetical protein